MAKKKKSKNTAIRKRVYIGIGEDGIKKYVSAYGETEEIANEEKNKIKAQLKKGIDVASGNDTFDTWAKKWLSMKKNSISESHYINYSCAIKHLNTEIKDIPISKVQLFQIQQVIDKLAIQNPTTKKPTAKKTLNDIKITAKQIFEFAIVNRVIDYNPANAITIPQKSPQNERRALTDEEIKRIEETPHKAQRASMIMLYSGLRRGELLALKWNDINFKENSISINKAIEFINGKPNIKTTKTTAGNRIIPMPQKLVDFLQSEQKTSIYVCDNKGGMHTQQSWRCLWDTYILDLDVKYGNATLIKKDGTVRKKTSKYDKYLTGITIDRFTPHYLRHTYATMLYKAGVDVLTAKYLLGHSDIKTTLGIYTHLEDEFAKKA